MQQRGRKSLANVVALNSVDGSPPRLIPPSTMSDAERKIFAATVAACDHLRASDLPLLQRYVEVVALSDIVSERLLLASQSEFSLWLFPRPDAQCRLVA